MDERLVNLEIFERSSAANVLASKLRAYGIFVHVDGQNGGLPHWKLIQMGGIPVKVRAKDYETAKAIMEDMAQSPPKRLSPIAQAVPAIVVLVCSAAMAALIVRARFWAASESLLGIFLVLGIAYVLAVGEAIRSRRQWWTLMTLPIAVLCAIDQFRY